MILSILSYPRSVIMGVLYPPYLLVASLITIAVNLVFRRRDFDDLTLKWWGIISCKMFGVQVKVMGLENIPSGGGVYLFNHTSFFDIFAMVGYLPSVRFGAKIELFKIPLFGWAMRRVGVLPIARGNREEVFKTYKDAEARLKSGEHIALAPEGTRQTEEKLGHFKSGPFVFAISAQVPVIPVVIRKASQILPKHAYFPNFGTWSREIQIWVLPAIDTKNFSVNERPILQSKVLEAMLPYFTTLHEELRIV